MPGRRSPCRSSPRTNRHPRFFPTTRLKRPPAQPTCSARPKFSGADGESGHVFHSGQALTIRINLRSPIENDDFVIGIGIFNAEGVCCYGTNTSIEDLKAVRIFGDAEARFTIESLDLVEGTYKFDVAVHKLDGYPYDYHRLLYTFRVKSRTKDVGIYRPRHAWRFSESMAFERTEQP